MREVEEGLADLAVEVERQGFQAIGLATQTAVQPFRGAVEEDRQVGHEPLGGPVRQPGDVVAQPAGAALVGDRRVDVAVADDDSPGRERRADDRLDVVGAVGSVEQGLGACVDV